jgi:peptidyl-tRNA hydrolase, PTH1 family
VLLVVGLGNPGDRYATTRHNIGFVVVETLAPAGTDWKQKFSGAFALCELEAERVGLLKPQTYMNESGRSVQAAAAFFKLDPSAVLVVHDELDLPFGDVRLKVGGGDAGHNGLRSVTAHLGSPEYLRVRVGIGRPPPEFAGRGADYVLQAFPSRDRPAVDELVAKAREAVLLTVARGVSAAMNTANQRKKP